MRAIFSRCVITFVVLSAQLDAGELETILDLWAARRQDVRTVQYEAKGTILIPKGTYSKEDFIPGGVDSAVPPEDYEHECSFSWRIDLENGRMSRETNRQVFHAKSLSFVPRYDLEVFDSNVGARIVPRERNTSKKYTPSQTQPDFFQNITRSMVSPIEVFLLCVNGHVSDSSFVPGQKDFCVRKVNAGNFSIVGEKEYEGATCTIVRTAPDPRSAKTFVEYWVDKSRGALIVKRDVWFMGKIAHSVACSYREREGGWIPARLKIDNFNGGSLDEAYLLNFVEVKLNDAIDVKEFQLAPEKGVVVRDLNPPG